MVGLYIHIPFCISKCKYCDFYRIAPFHLSEVDRFLLAFKEELKTLPAGFAPTTVFVGGGTPTSLSEKSLKELLQILSESINFSNCIEFSCEANPGTLTPEKCALLQEAGINRISMGVQSFNNKSLKMLGRIHTRKDAEIAFDQLRSAGFKNINIDLLQSLPGTSLEETLKDCRAALELNPEHLSSYNLIYEPNTPLTRQRDAGNIQEIDEDDEADRYFAVKDLFEKAGYEQYEISNFCKPSFRSLHNELYWKGDEYMGCGPSAHSHWGGRRFGNVENLEQYCLRLESKKSPRDFSETLPPEKKAREVLVMQLRMLEGVNLKSFEQQTGYSIKNLYGTTLNELKEMGLILQNTETIRLAPNALFISNTVFSALV